jgi:hypothetical protein
MEVNLSFWQANNPTMKNEWRNIGLVEVHPISTKNTEFKKACLSINGWQLDSSIHSWWTYLIPSQLVMVWDLLMNRSHRKGPWAHWNCHSLHTTSEDLCLIWWYQMQLLVFILWFALTTVKSLDCKGNPLCPEVKEKQKGVARQRRNRRCHLNVHYSCTPGSF